MNANCIICSELFEESSSMCTAICGHVYHTDCVTTWINQSHSCPCCRVCLNLNDIKKIYFNFQSRSENSFLSSSELQNEISDLKFQLLSKNVELTACKKEKNDTVLVAQNAEKKTSELQQTVHKLQSNISELHFRLESMTAFESKVSELERINKALSSDLEYSNNVQSIVSGSLKDAENKIKFYEEAMAISNVEREKHLTTGMSSESSVDRTPVVIKVSIAKRSTSPVDLSVKKQCLNQNQPGPSNINTRTMEGPSISLPEDENANEVEIIREVNATKKGIISASPTTLSREKQEPRRSDRIMASRNVACRETAPSMSIPEIVQGLQSNDSHIRYVAAQSATKLLFREKILSTDKLIEAGVVPSLVACLRCNDNVALQNEACVALVNISSGTSTQTQAVVQAGAIPFLIDLLSSPNVNVAEQAVWCLGNIAGDCPQLRDLVIDQGVIPPLLSLLTPNISTPFRRKITWTLSNLCRNTFADPPSQVVRDCLPVFAQLIHHKDPETIADACSAISYLTDGSNEKIQQVIDAGVVPRLVELLHGKEVTYIIPAIRSIANIASGQDLQTQTVLDAGALIPLKNLIRHENSDIVEGVCWTIANIIAGSVQQMEATISSGIMELVIKVLNHSDLKCQKEAAFAVANFANGGSLDQILITVQNCVIASMCNLLTVSDLKGLKILLDALNKILSAASNVGAKDNACSVIEQRGGLDIIKTLRQHENAAVSRSAIAIIDSHFSAENPFSY